MQDAQAHAAGLAIGTSSWTFPDWRGHFYPSGLPIKEQLAFYATQFNSVEVNTSFYALPAARTLLQWTEAVPDGFSFACKMPRAITHEKRTVACESDSLAYLEMLRSLGRAAAPGLVQFPPSLSRAGDGMALAQYLDWLALARDGIALAVEVRAGDLMTSSFATFLGERGLNLVLVEREGTPDLYPTWAALQSQGVMPPYLFLRLIGNDRQKLPHDRSIQRPQDGSLDCWAERIATQLAAGVSVFCFVHNPFEGHSPETVRRLLARINDHVSVPPWRPPAAKPSSTEPPDGQLPLF